MRKENLIPFSRYWRDSDQKEQSALDEKPDGDFDSEKDERQLLQIYTT